MPRLDPHSYTDDLQPQMTSLSWEVAVDFHSRTLTATATLQLDRSGESVDLDTRDLKIIDVTNEQNERLTFKVFSSEPILGSRLRIELTPRTRAIRIRYVTSPTASALKWLDREQTASGHPFVYSQCQALHARSIVPLQDTPRLRITFRAVLTVPVELKAVMAAGFVSREEVGREAIERFDMPQPIPPYLLAFAVGRLMSRELSPRSRVWAEPSIVDAAHWEFGEVEQMILAAEKLFGAYPWERFDILTMPPSFPYGGMENPRLTFLTPTLLAKDRSLVNVVAHELAHSWTGNLVTNANAEHFWLNEGFTVFAERRILEAIAGPDICALHAALGRRSLEYAMEHFKDRPELTKLRTHLDGIDPDEAFSQVPYEKGYLFLSALEHAAGREPFDRFVRSYVAGFRFRSITTEEFTAFVEQQLPGVLQRVGAEEWLEHPGIPSNAPVLSSKRLDALERFRGVPPDDATAKAWTPAEWQLYLERLRHPSEPAFCAELDRRFSLTASENYEVLVTWLVLASASNYAPALPRIREVLGTVGRMKYLKPLYQTLSLRAETRPVARDMFQQFKERYHPIAQQVIEALLQ